MGIRFFIRYTFSVRAGTWSQCDVQLAVQPSTKVITASWLFYRLHYGRRSGQNVEPDGGMLQNFNILELILIQCKRNLLKNHIFS